MHCRGISDQIFEGNLKTTRTCCLGRIFNDTDEYIAMHGLKQSLLTCGYLYIYFFNLKNVIVFVDYLGHVFIAQLALTPRLVGVIIMSALIFFCVIHVDHFIVNKQ